MSWIRISYIITADVGVCSPPCTMHLDGAHVKSRKFVEYGDDTARAAASFDSLEGVYKAGPFVRCEVFDVFADASGYSSWTTGVGHIGLLD
jgi:hypothetical protein